MNLTEIFHEYLSDVYWKGYANYLLEYDIAKYIFEFEEFLHIYST